jgi:hypothetical protein
MKLLLSAFRPGKRKDRVMQEDYDRGKCAALIKEAREIAGHLKVETESIRRQMARVLEGGEDEPLEVSEGSGHGNVLGARDVGKSFWQFWR